MQAVIYVIDSADLERVAEARDELNAILASEELRGVPLLVFANKQDLPNAIEASQLANRLGLVALRDRQWYIQACSATSGDGLYEGLDWMSSSLKRRG